MDAYFDLGTQTRQISTDSAEAQLWFDRGLNWCFAFHQEESVRCFQQVIHFDPHCALGYWGVAYAAGPNYNLCWEDFAPNELRQALAETHHHIQEALRRVSQASPVERALIHALTKRYQAPVSTDMAELNTWNDGYAAAMRRIFATFPEDDDLAYLTAEAFMCRTAWKLWDLVRREPAEGADTLEALSIVEAALQRGEMAGQIPHPGLLHLHIHLLEMSPTPERALPTSDQLRYLVPEAGHLLHMPSHIYMLCGQYEKALEANTDAIIADRKYAAYHEIIGLHTLSRCHNYQFKLHAGMMLGRFEPALAAAEEMISIIPWAGLTHEQDYLAHTLDGYSAMKAHVFIRFGKWSEIIVEPLPTEPDVYRFTTAMWHYAKGLAYAATHQITQAEHEQQRFEAAFARVSTSRRLFNNTCRDILAVAQAMLKGEVEYRKENYEAAFAHLHHSVELYDGLLYTEPWAWMQPVRHALGALLLEQGHVVEAEQVYRADLGLDDTVVRPSQHPDNIWSLHGYVECLERQNKTEELTIMKGKLEKAQAAADAEIQVSCFCRLTPHCCD